jgi:hypothetical protein
MDQFTREIIVEDRIRELRREAEQRGRQNGASRASPQPSYAAAVAITESPNRHAA